MGVPLSLPSIRLFILFIHRFVPYEAGKCATLGTPASLGSVTQCWPGECVLASCAVVFPSPVVSVHAQQLSAP